MRILVFGAGALGSLVAARLSARHEVSLVGRAEHVRAIRERGLLVTGRTECRATNIEAASSVSELEGASPDAVLLTVKSYRTARAAEELEPYRSTSILASLQNGLGNEELLAERGFRVLGAVINEGVTFLEPGKVFHAGQGETLIGPFSGTTSEDAAKLAAALDGSGIRAQAISGVREAIWKKVVLNAAVNPITALLSLRTGEVLELEPVVTEIVRESIAIARACGISLEEDSVLESIRRVAEATRENKSSMLQDLERGRPTEIDAINGALVERARALGVPAPWNELLTRLVRAFERRPR